MISKLNILKRLKGKNYLDVKIYLMRKLYLRKVMIVTYFFGRDYFFSNFYIWKQTGCISSRNLNTSFNNVKSLLIGNFDPNVFDATNLEDAKYCDDIIKHNFDLLGSGLQNLNISDDAETSVTVSHKIFSFRGNNYRRINWHRDFKSGYEWSEHEPYPESRNYTSHLGADIKVPWELSRAQHLPVLAVQWRITHNEVYYDEVLNQILDWIDANPLCYGPNWNCPMDVAIRCSNWLVALELLQIKVSLEDESLKSLIIKSLVQHYDYLKNNFEWSSKLTSNHYSSDIVGLAFCITYLPIRNRPKKLLWVVSELTTEIQKQFYLDGLNFEGSTYYHRLVYELYYYAYQLLKEKFNGELAKFKEILDRSHALNQFLVYDDGYMPQIGDNDSGYFLRLRCKPLMELSYLTCLDPSGDFMDNVRLELALLRSKQSENQLAHEKTGIRQGNDFVHQCKISGLVLGKLGPIDFCFTNGYNGQLGNGGHCHNDRLSFTLRKNGRALFLDPGTGVYTAYPDVRNMFRSTQSHNTFGINGDEQNRFLENGYLFGISEDITRAETAVYQRDNEVVIKASHNGYDRHPYHTSANRVFKYFAHSQTVCIFDSYESDWIGEAYFIVPSSLNLKVNKNCISCDEFIMNFEGQIGIDIQQMPTSDAYGKINLNGAIQISVKFKRHLYSEVQL